MNNSILQDILKQYEQKRYEHELELGNKKINLYKSCPKLEEIDSIISKLSIETAKSILTSNKNQIEDLKQEIEKLKMEKISILKNLGKPENYLTVSYDCPACKDTGYVLENNKTVICKCLKQKIYDAQYNTVNSNILKNETFKNFNLNLYSDTVNKELYNSNISPRANIEKIKKSALNFVENFEDLNTKNLLFSGGTGLGKTFLSNSIVNELLQKGKTVLYQTAPVMLDMLVANIFNKTEENSNLAENLLTVDLLVIDDLGTETMNSMKFTELYKIINTRLLNNKKPTKTIISTNLDLQGLFNNYDERLVSRFIGYYDIYRFFGDDIRIKKIKK